MPGLGRRRAAAARAEPAAAAAGRITPLPADFPPAWTVYYWAAKWQASGATETMHGQLRTQVRLLAGRTGTPTAAIIDSQSVKGSEQVTRASRGYDAGKKINGRKRHIAVDTIGLLLTVLITAASIQDRDAAKPLLWNLKRRSPRSGSLGPTAATPASCSAGPRPCSSPPSRSSDGPTTCTPSRSCPAARSSKGRWPGSPHRRTVRDYERLPAHHETYVYWAMIIVMTRRLARTPPQVT